MSTNYLIKNQESAQKYQRFRVSDSYKNSHWNWGFGLLIVYEKTADSGLQIADSDSDCHPWLVTYFSIFIMHI